MKQIIIYCDGACSGNPGPGGWGSIVGIENEIVVELGASAQQTTNNQMELQACISAFEFLLGQDLDSKSKIDVFTDSVYVIRGITQWIWGWQRNAWKTSDGKEVSNKELWQDLAKFVRKMESLLGAKAINWNYVRGHTGIAGNERCDVIAVEYSKNQRPHLYEGTPEHYHFDLFKRPKFEALPENKSFTEKKKALSYLSLIGSIAVRHKSWADCERRVKGQSGAKFKKANSEAEELEILNSWGVSPQNLKDEGR